MASKFANVVSAFNKFKDDNNLMLSYNQTRGYGWRIGENLKQELMQHIDNEWPDAPEKNKNDFKMVFQDGNDFLGIPILGTVGGDKTNKLFLLKAKRHAHSTQFKDVLWKKIESIVNGKKLKCPVTNRMFDWHLVIAPESLKIKDSNNEYIDIPSDKTRGKISYKQYEEKKVNTNDVHGVSVFGLVNYKTGIVEISRNDDQNAELLEELIEEHNTAPAGGSGSDSGSGSGSDSDSSTEKKPPVYHFTDDFNINCEIYTEPISIVWTFDSNINE